MPESTLLRAQYEDLKDRASEILRRGSLRKALSEFENAYGLAKRIGDRDLEDIAFCNRSAVAIRLGTGSDLVPALRQMLLRTADPQVAFLSAYNLARAYDTRKNYRKALFYARIAHRYAVDLDDSGLQASALNWIGNALVALNDFTGGLNAYREGDALLQGEDSERRSLILSNLGYCLLLTGETPEGFQAVILGLRMARRAEAPVAESIAHLCLAFAHLLVERPWHAARHGSRSLELAEAHDDPPTVKLALLLLGGAYRQAEDLDTALKCFEILQRTFYPGMPQVPEMLLGVDICRVINLKG